MVVKHLHVRGPEDLPIKLNRVQCVVSHLVVGYAGDRCPVDDVSF
jgi:hypothetical protein